MTIWITGICCGNSINQLLVVVIFGQNRSIYYLRLFFLTLTSEIETNIITSPNILKEDRFSEKNGSEIIPRETGLKARMKCACQKGANLSPLK